MKVQGCPQLQPPKDFNALGPVSDIDETLSPIYETVRNVAAALPNDTTLIGFAGAPWTVATYMIAGRGTPDQGPAHRLMNEDPTTFDALMERITAATIEYLAAQIDAGADVVKIFDSWAGSLKGSAFQRYALEPTKQIISALKARFPNTPIIAFPREAADGYIGFAKSTGAELCRLRQLWFQQNGLQKTFRSTAVFREIWHPKHMVTGGQPLVDETRRIIQAFSAGPHIFNLGHGITPDANPDNVQLMIDTVRSE